MIERDNYKDFDDEPDSDEEAGDDASAHFLKEHHILTGNVVLGNEEKEGQEQVAFQDTKLAELKMPPLPEFIQGSLEKVFEQKESRGDLASERQRLIEDAKDKLGEHSEYYRDFLKNMDKFEARIKKGQVTADEVAKTYDQVDKLLTRENAKVSVGDRKLLAENILSHAGDPTNIDQGHYETCGVTALGDKLFTNHPSKAAELIVSAALDGQVKDRDGKIIKIDAQSLIPMTDSRQNPPEANHRSFATQLLNNVLINEVEQRMNPPKMYKQIHDINGNPLPDGDDGERLVDMKTGKEIARYGREMTAANLAYEYGNLTGENLYLIANKQLENDSVLVGIHSAKELGEVLKEAKEKGLLPMMVEVDANWPMFGGPRKEHPNDAAKHMVLITDIEDDGMVAIDNSWFKDADKKVYLADFYQTTTDYHKNHKGN